MRICEYPHAKYFRMLNQGCPKCILHAAHITSFCGPRLLFSRFTISIIYFCRNWVSRIENYIKSHRKPISPTENYFKFGEALIVRRAQAQKECDAAASQKLWSPLVQIMSPVVNCGFLIAK